MIRCLMKEIRNPYFLSRSFSYKLTPRVIPPVVEKKKIIPPLKVYEAEPIKTTILPEKYAHPMIVLPLLEKKKERKPILFSARKRFCPYSVRKMNLLAYCVCVLLIQM